MFIIVPDNIAMIPVPGANLKSSFNSDISLAPHTLKRLGGSTNFQSVLLNLCK